MSPVLFVRALYDFDPSDPSSLSFKKNDIIRVLAQLESGWWDGLCNDERGWFPSNYVTTLDKEGEILNEDDELYNWIHQQTSDGEVFYYNIKTGESSWVPMNDNKSIAKVHTAGHLPENLIQQSTEDGNTYYYNVKTKETGSVPSDTDDEKLDSHVKGDSEGIDTAEKLPPNTNGQLIKTENNEKSGPDDEVLNEPLTPTSISYTSKRISEQSIFMLQNASEYFTWDTLSRSIDLSIHNLNKAIQGNMKQDYPDCTNAIVGIVRIMLYASGTIEKDSAIIKQNKSLRNYHRNILTSLTKLVISTKVAAGAWSPIDATQRMKNDAFDVLDSACKFIQIAQQVVEIRRVDPRIIESATGGSWRGNNSIQTSNKTSISSSINPKDNSTSNSSSYNLTPELINFLDKISHAVTQSIVLLLNYIKKVIDVPNSFISTPQLISQTKEVLTQVGQFLSIIEGIDLKDLDESSFDTINEFNVAKQALYKNIARLVICVQTATDPLFPLNSVDQILVCANVVDKSVKDIITTTKFLLVKIQGMRSGRPSAVEILEMSKLLNNSDSLDQINGNDSENSVENQSLTSPSENTNPPISKSLTPSSDNTNPPVSNSLTPPSDNTNPPVSNSLTPSSDNTNPPVFNSLTPSSDNTNPPVPNSLTPSSDNTNPPVSNSLTDNTDLSVPRSLTPSSDNTNLPVSKSLTPSSDSTSPPVSKSLPTLPTVPENSIITNDDLISDADSNKDDVPISPNSSTGRLQRSYTQSSNVSVDSSSSTLNGSSNSRFRSKLSNFFGEDVSSNITQSQKQKEDKPWFLNYDYDSSEMVFNMESSVKGGTLSALIERLTMHDLLDTNFIATFLLTYRSFCTTDDFFDMLVKRFMIQPPESLTPEELEVWQEKKQTPVRLRVFNIMKTWLESYYIDDEDLHCLEKMREFARTTMHEHMAFAAVSLTKVIEKRQQQRKDAKFKELIMTNSLAPPAPILPKNIKKLRFLDIDPLEIARQLTLIESKLYNKIKPVECLGKAWSQSEGDNVAVNIKAMIVNSNKITGWVAESVLNQKEIRKRCLYIKHFVAVADKCRCLNNFNSLTAITSGLYSAPIHRLKRTWEMVNARTAQTLESLSRIMNSTKNFAEYREMLHSINPPCVPFFGLYLTDLTFIEDGNPDFLKNSNQLINFSKRMKTADVIREIQQYQSAPYNLNPVKEIQMFIKCHLQDSRDVKDLYDQSLNLEPREREDEKIARLLQESGFL